MRETINININIPFKHKIQEGLISYKSMGDEKEKT